MWKWALAPLFPPQYEPAVAATSTRQWEWLLFYLAGSVCVDADHQNTLAFIFIYIGAFRMCHHSLDGIPGFVPTVLTENGASGAAFALLSAWFMSKYCSSSNLFIPVVPHKIDWMLFCLLAHQEMF